MRVFRFILGLLCRLLPESMKHFSKGQQVLLCIFMTNQAPILIIIKSNMSYPTKLLEITAFSEWLSST